MSKLKLGHNFVCIDDERNTPVAVLCVAGMEYANMFVEAPEMYEALEAFEKAEQHYMGCNYCYMNFTCDEYKALHGNAEDAARLALHNARKGRTEDV